jgi:hypothetical protein
MYGGPAWKALFPAHLFVAIDPGRDIPRLREIDGAERRSLEKSGRKSRGS